MDVWESDDVEFFPREFPRDSDEDSDDPSFLPFLCFFGGDSHGVDAFLSLSDRLSVMGLLSKLVPL